MTTPTAYPFQYVVDNEHNRIVLFILLPKTDPTSIQTDSWNVTQRICELYSKGGRGTAFVNGNQRYIEYIASYENHTEKEYQYYINEKGLVVAKKFLFKNKKGKYFSTFFEGHYDELKKYDMKLEGHQRPDFDLLFLINGFVSMATHWCHYYALLSEMFKNGGITLTEAIKLALLPSEDIKSD